MKEKGLEQVDISDISPDNFKEFLRFIYTDRVQFTEKNAEPLLAAADKYLIPTLKWKCEEYLIEYLTTENCIELMRMADLHNTFNLKSITRKDWNESTFQTISHRTSSTNFSALCTRTK